MIPPDLLGTIAACLTTGAFVPQVIKTVKTRHTRDISLLMWLMMNTGIVLWLIYGLMIQAWPVIMSNVVTIGLSSTILAIKIANWKKDALPEQAPPPAP